MILPPLVFPALPHNRAETPLSCYTWLDQLYRALTFCKGTLVWQIQLVELLSKKEELFNQGILNNGIESLQLTSCTNQFVSDQFYTDFLNF